MHCMCTACVIHNGCILPEESLELRRRKIKNPLDSWPWISVQDPAAPFSFVLSDWVVDMHVRKVRY